MVVVPEAEAAMVAEVVEVAAESYCYSTKVLMPTAVLCQLRGAAEEILAVQAGGAVLLALPVLQVQWRW